MGDILSGVNSLRTIFELFETFGKAIHVLLVVQVFCYYCIDHAVQTLQHQSLV